ncbi:MAG: fluoride efflux transporter CrcB [Alphaproteobacteria bacterium]|nr:fluoride efflux transporter CrcB [Alphaproteobacteria bacterium]
MQTILAIAAGGAVGALLRHFLNSGITHFLGSGFPWGIFAANVLGSFMMGVFISGFAHLYDPPQAVRAFLTVGLLGAFTTFSTFSMDTVLLIERGQYLAAGIYAGASVLLGVSGLLAGMFLVRFIVA